MPGEQPAQRHPIPVRGLDHTETRYGAEGKGPSIYLRDPERNTVELKGPPYP